VKGSRLAPRFKAGGKWSETPEGEGEGGTIKKGREKKLGENLQWGEETRKKGRGGLQGISSSSAKKSLKNYREKPFKME